jgi:hypothetical protein
MADIVNLNTQTKKWNLHTKFMIKPAQAAKLAFLLYHGKLTGYQAIRK